MSQKHVQWLREELPSLVSQGVLTTEAAERVRHYYNGREQGARGRNRAVVLFGILGAGLIGGGIILLLAHNWDQLSRVMRTVLSLAPLVVAQAVAGWVLWTRRGSTAWREGAGIALTLAIGTSISLIAQTYNISGDFGPFMLTWTLLALPVIYLLDSSMAAMYLVGERWFEPAASWWQRPFRTVGALGGFGLALFLTCKWPWHQTVVDWKGNQPTEELVMAFVWPVLALVLWIESLVRRRAAGSMFGALTIVAGLGYLVAAGRETGELLATVLFDIFLFALGVGTLWRGLREDRLGVVNGGMLMLAGLIVTRFFDSDLGFVVRGLAFIGVGIGFLVTNVVLIRRKGAVA